MTTPIAQFLFNDNANDETGTYNGTPANVTYEALPAGVNYGGKVAIFNGTSAVIVLPDIASFAGSGAKSIEGWIYLQNSNTIIANIFGCGNNDASNKVFALIDTGSAAPAGKLAVKYDNTTGNNYSSGVNTSTLYNLWKHYAVVYNGTNLIFYIEGQNVSSQAATLSPNNDNFGLGVGGAGGNFGKFKAANFRIYNAALSAGEVLEHYNLEAFPPATTNYLKHYRRSRICGSITGV